MFLGSLEERWPGHKTPFGKRRPGYSPSSTVWNAIFMDSSLELSVSLLQVLHPKCQQLKMSRKALMYQHNGHLLLLLHVFSHPSGVPCPHTHTFRLQQPPSVTVFNTLHNKQSQNLNTHRNKHSLLTYLGSGMCFSFWASLHFWGPPGCLLLQAGLC